MALGSSHAGNTEGMHLSIVTAVALLLIGAAVSRYEISMSRPERIASTSRNSPHIDKVCERCAMLSHFNKSNAFQLNRLNDQNRSLF
jgi:hypothetical protein